MTANLNQLQLATTAGEEIAVVASLLSNPPSEGLQASDYVGTLILNLKVLLGEVERLQGEGEQTAVAEMCEELVFVTGSHDPVDSGSVGSYDDSPDGLAI